MLKKREVEEFFHLFISPLKTIPKQKNKPQFAMSWIEFVQKQNSKCKCRCNNLYICNQFDDYFEVFNDFVTLNFVVAINLF